MVRLELLELLIKLLVPGVQHADLEGERGAGDDEVGEGEAAGDQHVDCCFRLSLVVRIFKTFECGKVQKNEPVIMNGTAHSQKSLKGEGRTNTRASYLERESV